MKKILSIIFAAGMIISIAAFSASAAKIAYTLGDANGDGIINIDDVTIIQRKLASYSVDSFKSYAADVNGKGVSVTDVTALQRYLAEFGDSNSIGKTFYYDPYELPVVPTK